MKCNNCKYYGLYRMVSSGRPYQFFGDIPCLNCSRFNPYSDKFEEVTERSHEDDIYKLEKE